MPSISDKLLENELIFTSVSSDDHLNTSLGKLLNINSQSRARGRRQINIPGAPKQNFMAISYYKSRANKLMKKEYCINMNKVNSIILLQLNQFGLFKNSHCLCSVI